MVSLGGNNCTSSQEHSSSSSDDEQAATQPATTQQATTQFNLEKFKRTIFFLINRNIDDLADLRIGEMEKIRQFRKKVNFCRKTMEALKDLQKDLEVEEPSTEPLPLLNITNTAT